MEKQPVHLLQDDSPRSRVTNYLREKILSGTISAGEILPAERKLAQQFNVSRSTIRVALDILKKEKLIQSRKNCKKIATPRSIPQKALLSRTFVILTSLCGEAINLGIGSPGSIEAGIFYASMRKNIHGLLLQQNALDDGYLDMILRGSPCGILVTSEFLGNGKRTQQLIEILKDCRLPMVINSASTEFPDCDRVIFDHAAGCALLTEYFLNQGCQRILRVWSSAGDADWVRERNRGYEEAMNKAGLQPLEAIHADHLNEDRHDLPSRARSYAGLLVEILRSNQPPEAILATTDSDVFAIVAACRMCGYEPGEDIQIVGYDNIWKNAPELTLTGYAPPVTIDKQNFLAGQLMINLLAERLKDPSASWKAELVSPKLVIS